jgi:hypothetical protein
MSSGPAAAPPTRVEYSEEGVPLEGIDETIEAVVLSHGGVITGSSQGEIRFHLPLRPGVAATGSIEARFGWEKDSDDPRGGIVTLTADDEVSRPSWSYVALLLAGTVGALLFILWPFYPALGAASWVGGALAFSAWFLTLKRSRSGLIARMLDNVADAQRMRVGGE